MPSLSASPPARLSVGFARRVMAMAPPQLLSPALKLLLGKMRRRHPALFLNLEDLEAASILVVPTDLCWRFLLTYGGKTPLALILLRRTLTSDQHNATASIKGTLETLFNLLEGECDGDTQFFSRALTISGNTAAIIALRNTLDRENINLLDEVTALCGSFAKPAQHIITRLDRLILSMRCRHTHTPPDSGRSAILQTECDKLRADNYNLINDLAKFKVRARRISNETA